MSGGAKKLRVGFIGAGAITDLHYLGYQDYPKAELHAICDVDEALLQRRASEWRIGKTYTDYRHLLADPEVDAVEVITPHHLHAEMGIAALEAGKHVSIQKPMAITVAECDALIEAAARAGKLMRVFENFRFYPPLVKAKQLLDGGAIGEPLSIRIKCVQGTSGEDWEIPYRRWVWRFDPARSGGGRVILDYGYHLFSIAQWFMGAPEKVFAWITHRPIQHGWMLDSPAVVIWKYKDAEKYGYLRSGDLRRHSGSNQVRPSRGRVGRADRFTRLYLGESLHFDVARQAGRGDVPGRRNHGLSRGGLGLGNQFRCRRA